MQYSTKEFETLYSICFPPSMRLAMSLLHEEDEARDIVQGVFLRLWESENVVDNPKAFIIRSVRNACLNRINMLDTREKIKKSLVLNPPPDEEDYDDRNELVRTAVGRLLSSREQQIIDYIYTEGMSYKEAATNLGLSIATVNKSLVTALKKLRNHFKTGKS